MTLIITAPGFYQQSNGERCVVKYCDTAWALGFNNLGGPTVWKSDGKTAPHIQDSIIAPWVAHKEPRRVLWIRYKDGRVSLHNKCMPGDIIEATPHKIAAMHQIDWPSNQPWPWGDDDA